MHHHEVQTVSFFELWHLDVLVFVVMLSILFLHFSKRLSEPENVKKRQIRLFLLAMAIFFISEGSPLAYYGHHYLFSVHMVQMALTLLVVPPLLLVSIPRAGHEWTMNAPVVGRIFRFLTRPVIALFVFTGLFSIYHIPFIYNTLMDNSLLHFIFYSLLFITALTMFWPVVTPLPDYKRLSDLRKMAYIFAGGVLLTPACALIIFADTPLYTMYVHAPRLFEMLTPLGDQQLGGVLMKIMQEIIYGIILGYIFYNWYRKENKANQIDSEEAALAKLKMNKDFA